MSFQEIIKLVLLVVVTVGLIGTIIIDICKGKMKDFIVAKMEEAEEKFKDDSDKAKKKLEYVIDAVKEHYKLISIVLNIKRFIEKVISVTKKINAK